MRAANLRRVVLAFLLSAGMLAADAAAQTAATFCDAKVANEPATSDPLHPSAVYRSFQLEIERNQWGRIATALEEDFATSNVQAKLEPRVREAFARNLKIFADEMRETEKNFPESLEKAKGVNLVRFTVHASADEQGEYFIFDRPDRIDITSKTDLEVAKELCYRAFAVLKLATRYGEAGRALVVTTLEHYVRLWDNYNNKGYSQYPWELYLNGLWTFKSGQFVPPARQWIIAHPAIAIEATFPRSSDLRRLDIITVEPIGYLRYTRDRTTYRGVSALVTLSATADPGFGGLLHIGRVGKVGYVYHLKDKDAGIKARHGAVFSVDLYKIIAGVPDRLKDLKAKVEAARDSAREAVTR